MDSPNIAPGAISQSQDLAEVLKSLLAPLQAQLSQLADNNKTIQAENEQLRQALLEREADAPSHLLGDDFPVNPRAARSVVIATRPVVENPDRYRAKSIVDHGKLSINDASQLSGKNRE